MSKRQTNMSARKVIETKSTTAVGDKEFFLAIESAILDGYRICTNYSRADNTSRNHLGFMGRCVLYKNGKEFLDDVPSLTEDSTPEVASKEVEAEPAIETELEADTVEDELPAELEQEAAEQEDLEQALTDFEQLDESEFSESAQPVEEEESFDSTELEDVLADDEQSDEQTDDTLSPDEEASVEDELSAEEKSVDWAELEKLSKKKEVLEWAKTNKFEVPEGLNVPAQIKKHLKDTYQK